MKRWIILTRHPPRRCNLLLLPEGCGSFAPDWWEKAASRVDLYASVIVVDEVSQGDAEAAQKRLAIVDELKLLQRTTEVDDLAACYEKDLPIPEKAVADCYHLAFACGHGMDYLVSWNMAHIVSGSIILRIQELNAVQGIRTPVICTPEELMEEP